MRKFFLKSLLALLTIVSFSSCASALYPKKYTLNDIQPGMTQEEVNSTFGRPDFRRFDREREEWEYNKWISNRNTVIIVFFENGRVTAMDSFEKVQPPQISHNPVPQVIVPDVRPTYPPYFERMNDAEFQLFYQKVKAQPFSDDRKKMIKALSTSKRLTCKQCTQLLSFFHFSDEKMNIFRLFAPHLVDKENYIEIQNQFPSFFDKEDVKKILGI